MELADEVIHTPWVSQGMDNRILELYKLDLTRDQRYFPVLADSGKIHIWERDYGVPY